MAKITDYIKSCWNRHFATTAEEKFPALDDHQKAYRVEFGNIVDQYLVFYRNEERNGKKYKSIVYIDAENDIDWIDEGDNLSEEEMKKRNQYIALLDVVHALPVKNLSKKEVVNFKKLLGVGYAAALYQNWDEVKMAIENAKQYRDDRNKEHSRFLLLSAAAICLAIIAGMYLAFVHFMQSHPHFNLFTGMVMGAFGSYVSIWTRYGKLDMTGLSTPSLHYLEAFSRIFIGMIFSLIIILTLKSGVIFNNLITENHEIYLYCLLGFCAGFSEKFVPTIMENFMNNSKKE